MRGGEKADPRMVEGAPNRGGPHKLLAAVFATLAALVVGVGALGIALLDTSGEAFTRHAGLWSAAAVALLLALTIAWAVVRTRLLRPFTIVGRELEVLLHSPSSGRVIPAATEALGRTGSAIAAVASRLLALRSDTDRAIAAAGAQLSEEKRRLEAILLDLSEGVIVCAPDHKIVLYNRAAVRLLGAENPIGLGRSLFAVISREPVLHTVELLAADKRTHPDAARERSAGLVAATTDGRRLLRARMTLVCDIQGSAEGYVVSLADVGAELGELARRDRLLHAATEGLRGPVANIRTTAEAIAATEMEGAARSAFEANLITETTQLSDRVDALSAEARTLQLSHWPMDDVNSADLVRCAAQHLEERCGIVLIMTGMPLWLRANSHDILLLLEFLIEKLAARSHSRRFDVETLLADKNVYFEVRWAGDPIPSNKLDEWLQEPLPGALGGATASRVLERHDSEIWSFARGATASLRFPVPAPRRPQFLSGRRELPVRPEFYDFDLSSRINTSAGLDRLLAEADYVVFDTETTGLRPDADDEIVALGAVRIVNRRVLTGETFERTVDPRRSIPPTSTKFHGITDAMVKGRPPIAVVLPQFDAFARGAVLVAHNAPFDMAFLLKHDPGPGYLRDNPVLDTLLLAGSVLDHMADHSLDALARRFDVPIDQRHSALADAMVTALLFLRLIDLLEGRGVRTLREALALTGRTAELRRREMQA
jgi:DNA polymerase-3 subunit epsilon